MRGLFVTGTDTGVGKSVVSAAIAASLRRSGVAVAACKPVLTGVGATEDPDWPPDDELLALAAGVDRRDVATARYDPPVSPHLAAERSGRPIDPAALVEGVRRAAAEADAVIVEGVGGLLVPLTPEHDVRELARELGLPLVVAARPGLGTISHSRLTVEAARAARLHVAGIVMTPWPRDPTPLEVSNRDTVAAWTGVEVATVPTVPGPDPDRLADAGDGLPLARWLDGAA